MAASLTLRDVRPWGGERVDVVVTDGVVSAVGTGLAGADAFDGAGLIALPSFTDAHAHLDSTRLGLPFRPHTAGPGLIGLIENDRANWREAERGVAERATHTLGVTIASGVTRVRSHAQVDTDSRLDRLHGVLAAREAHRDRADVEVVAFPQCGIVRDPGTADLLDAALDEGADLVGGIDPCALERDPVEHLDVVFGLAERHQVGVDIHLHEAGELGAFTFDLILERVAALSMHGRVTVSHAFALATNPEPVVADLIARIAELDVALTTVAPSGGRALPQPLLAAAGVRVGLGQDGIRDYWSPYGDGDLLGRTWQLAFVQGLRHDELIEQCVALATLGGRGVIDPGEQSRRPWQRASGVDVGDPADLVLVRGDTVAAAVMDRAAERVVVHRGAIVARDLRLS